MMRVDKLNEVVTKKLDPRLIGDLPGKTDREGNPIKYISGEAMLILLREAFGPYFSVEYGEPHYVQYAKNKPNDPDPNRVLEVKCTITVPLYDPETKQTVIVKREGFGTAAMRRSFEEMILKTAQTDALKKAAYSFGFALELFMKAGGEKDWADAELYGIWTHTAGQQHQQELMYVNAAMQKFGWKDMNEFAVKAFNDPTARLTPLNITEAVKAFQKKMEEKKKGEKAA